MCPVTGAAKDFNGPAARRIRHREVDRVALMLLFCIVQDIDGERAVIIREFAMIFARLRAAATSRPVRKAAQFKPSPLARGVKQALATERFRLAMRPRLSSARLPS